MSAEAITLTLRYAVGEGWFIIEDGAGRERELGGPFAGIEQAIDERAKLAEAFDRDSAVAS